MITEIQMQRALDEFLVLAKQAFDRARIAERDLESYERYRPYVPNERQRLLEAFQEADYVAESRAWVVQLIRAKLTAAQNSEMHSGATTPGE